MTSGLGTYLATCALPASILAGSPGRWIGTALVVVFAASGEEMTVAAPERVLCGERTK